MISYGKKRATSLFLSAGVALLAGCATPRVDMPPMPPLEQATLTPEPPPEEPIQEAERVPADAGLRREPPRPTGEDAARVSKRGPSAVITAANEFSRQQPEMDHFFNAVQRYIYEPGAIYQVYTKPGRVTRLELAPDETLIDFVAGDADESRWTIEISSLGKKRTLRRVITVRPKRYDMLTNLQILTTMRPYDLELISPAKSKSGSSTAESYMFAVSWQYPEIEQKKRREAIEDRLLAEKEAAEAALPNCVRYRYRIEAVSKPTPVWMPVSVCDDEERVKIQFPDVMEHVEAPVLYVETSQGKPQITNYRPMGTVYIVDRLFQDAELRVGGEDKEADIVSIRRVRD